MARPYPSASTVAKSSLTAAYNTAGTRGLLGVPAPALDVLAFSPWEKRVACTGRDEPHGLGGRGTSCLYETNASVAAPLVVAGQL